MSRDGTQTRQNILDAAEALVLRQGFAATSIDRVIDNAGITKGTFFYHFKTKNDLALALVDRYARMDAHNLETNLLRAEKLSRDPLQQVLIFVGLFREMLDGLTEPAPGCLFASYCVEAQLFDVQTHKVIRDAMQHWRERLGAKFDEVIARYPPHQKVAAAELADMITVVFEGGFIMSKIMTEPNLVAAQLDHYRNYLELLFAPRA
ncbi:MAG: TetR/AcrR family transcriptional regulator [Alphaproteobacteria bacterium]